MTVVLAGASAGAAVVNLAQGNIRRVDIGALVTPLAQTPGAAASGIDDPNAARPVNLLLLGSDDRSGENGAIGGANAGMRSDTAIVMHISADRGRVELVSIPRDSLVDVPACTMSDRSTTPARRAVMFNSAFATGWDHGGDIASAAACTAATVQANTGVSIDHVAVVDFAGFQQMVDAVGGVSLCVPTAMTDEETGLDLPAGMNTLDGVTALEYARARYVPGTDKSDLTRIGHQQQLMAALAHQVMSKDTLTDPAALVAFVSAATSALTTDSTLTLSSITGLAYSLRGIDGAQVVLTTIPTAPAPSDRYRVVWTDRADGVWAAMAHDTPIVGALGEPAAPGAPDAATPPPTTGPAPTGSAPLPADVTSVDQVQDEARGCAA